MEKLLLSPFINLPSSERLFFFSLLLFCTLFIGSGQGVVGQTNNWYDDYDCVDALTIYDQWAQTNFNFGNYGVPVRIDNNGNIALFDYCNNCNGNGVENIPVPIDPISGVPLNPVVPPGYTRHLEWARSPCGLSYYPRYLPIAPGPTGIAPLDIDNDGDLDGDCTPCACANGATNIACDLLPDLVPSAWNVANAADFYKGTPPTLLTRNGYLLNPNTFQLALTITVFNLGEGPFEIKRDALPQLTPDGHEIIHQIKYQKPIGGVGVAIEESIVNTTNLITGAYHAEHSHFHVDDWVTISLRRRPASTHADYNNPLNWTVVGTSQKLSFCLVESSSTFCAVTPTARYGALDLSTAETMQLLNTTPNLWTNTNIGSILNNAENNLGKKIVYNELSDFPNLGLGKYNYHCIFGHQGISPGYGDTYALETPGNFINLPCDLTAGTYYIVIEADPNDLFVEKNEENNVTVVPYQFAGFANSIQEEAPVNVQSWSYQEGEAGNSAIWTTPNRFNRLLKVPSGFTLTLDHTTMEFLTPNSGILVQPGGTLILNNSVLRNNECLNNAWAGIQCWGTLIVDGCVMPNGQTAQNAKITGVCGQSLKAQQNSLTVNSFEAYNTTITPDNYTQNFTTNLIGSISLLNTPNSFPATFSYTNNLAPAYTFVSTITSGCGGTQLICTNPSRIYQNIATMPAISITGGGTQTVCGSGQTLSAVPNNANFTYLWTPHTTDLALQATTPQIYTEIGGTYTVTVTNAWGCSTTAQTTFNKTTASVSLTTTATNCSSLVLNTTVNNGTPPYEYQWFNANLDPITSATSSSLNLNSDDIGYYMISVSNAQGCVATNSIIISSSQLWDALDFNGIYTVGAMPNPLGTVVGVNETWGTNRTVAGTIIVPSGSVLTINATCTLYMRGYDSQIIVQPGGPLDLNGCKIQGDACINNSWQGIRVLATTTATPYSDADPIIAFNNGAGQYGLLTTTGNVTIKHARVGACNGLLQSDNNVNNVGGIIKLNNTTFEDSGIGVWLLPTPFVNTQPAQPHSIVNCSFNMQLNTPFSADYWHPATQQPVGIWAKNLKLVNTLQNNRFVSTMNSTTTPQDKRGIGIRLDNVHAKIDAAVEPLPEFDGLFKGIDVINIASVQKPVNIQRQNFNNTRKAVTLANAVGSTISNNEFRVPPANGVALDTYGLMCASSKGNVIQNNVFKTGNVLVANTKGAIIDNSASGLPTAFNNNLFDGNFEVATQFKGNNLSLNSNCNAYDDCQVDWHLNSTATLPTQGVCNGDPTNALRTHWHYTTDPGITFAGNHFHIRNDNTAFDLKLNIDNSPQSNPKMPTPNFVVGTVTVEQCSTDPLFANNSCTVSFPIAGQAKTATECTNGNSLEQMLYDYIVEEQSDSLFALLQCLDEEEWATQLVAGTYIDEGQYDLAAEELQSLDSTDANNAEFIALCTAIMDSTLSTSDTEGGRLASALQQTQHIANNANSNNQTFAEALLALYKNADYVRHGEPLDLKYALHPALNGNSFSIVPNPAQDVVTITRHTETTEATHFIIYDLNSKVVATIPVNKGTQQLSVSCSYLPSGMYYCRFVNGIGVEKLVIIGK